jgi:hypothetical protein
MTDDDDVCPDCGGPKHDDEDERLVIVDPTTAGSRAMGEAIAAANGAMLAMWQAGSWTVAWDAVQLCSKANGVQVMPMIASVWASLPIANRRDWDGVVQLLFTETGPDSDPIPLNEIPPEFLWAAHLIGARMVADSAPAIAVLQENRGLPAWEVEDRMHALLLVAVGHATKAGCVTRAEVDRWRKTSSSRWS